MFAKIITALALVALVHGEAHLEGSGSGVRPSAAYLAAATTCATTLCSKESLECVAIPACMATITAQEAPLAGSTLATCTSAAPYLKCIEDTMAAGGPTAAPTNGAATLGYFVGLVVAVAATMF